MVFFLKPMQWLAIALTTTALILYIIALSSPTWYRVDNAGSNLQYGPFRSCARIWSYQIDECRPVSNSCNVDFSAPLGDTGAGFGNCNRLRAVRALGLIALFSTLFALVPMLATACITHDLALRLTSAFWSFLAAVCGVICMALYASESFPDRALYGYAFALCTAAWILNVISGLTSLFPSPIALPATAEMAKGAPLVNDPMYGSAAYPATGTARPSISSNYPVQSTYPVQTSLGQPATHITTSGPATLV